MMNAFLEFEEAYRLRNVKLEPFSIGWLFVATPDTSLWTLIKAFLAFRKFHRIQQAK